MTADTQYVLSDGSTIPRLGLGVFQASGGDAERSVAYALKGGYRHIDTAAIYKNEGEVGRGMKASGVPRDDIYLTTKIWNEDMRQGRCTQALGESLERLGTDYVDLCLLHWPVEGRAKAWQELIDAKDAGKVRSIGVSNFTAEHIKELVMEFSVKPVLNQIEFHPYLTQPEITQACQEHDIAVEAWAPLMQGAFVDEPVFSEVSARHDKSAAQVVLRWALQRDVIAIPKSVTPSRIDENIAIYDFELSEKEMKRIDGLERKGRVGPDPYDFDF